jgi:hypothetical protein
VGPAPTAGLGPLFQILPFEEQDNLYKQANPILGWSAQPATFVGLATQSIPPLYLCQSSGTTPGFSAQYVAVMGPIGAVNPYKKDAMGNPVPYSFTASAQGGQAAEGALTPILPPPFNKITIDDIKDGRSSTIFWAESNWESQIPGSGPTAIPWYAGCEPASSTTGGCGSSRNVTGLIGKNGSLVGAYTGTNLNTVSIGSAHLSLLHVGMGDGSVQTINDQIDPNILLGLASRNGKEVVSIP